MNKLLWIALLGIVGFGSGAFAKQTTYDYRPDVERIAKSFDKGDVETELGTALDSLISTAVAHMRAHGRSLEANQIADQWQHQYRGRLRHLRNVGDHEPLFTWLRYTYAIAEWILGKPLMKQLRLTDLNTLNYVLPVVFNPAGKGWDKREYRKHFVPLAGIITYWGTYLGCRLVIEWELLQKVCDPAANAASWLMEKTVAPGLSDTVYKHFGGKGFR